MTAPFVCDALACRRASSPATCTGWRFGCTEGRFRRVVSDFRSWGDWSVHEWGNSGKFYAKLFGPGGFVTIEDLTFRRWGYRVAVRLRRPAGEAEWREFPGLSADDGSLAAAVAHACGLAGIEERNRDERT